jgi:hypothetical protein
MKFFVPQAKPSEYNQVYQGICDSVKDQLGWKLSPRRIASLRHLQHKTELQFEVGQLAPPENYYQVLAILESNAYIIYTRSSDGRSGTTILIDKAEVLAVTDFNLSRAQQEKINIE